MHACSIPYMENTPFTNFTDALLAKFEQFHGKEALVRTSDWEKGSLVSD